MIKNVKNRINSEKNKKELIRTNVRCMMKIENKRADVTSTDPHVSTEMYYQYKSVNM